MLEELTKFSDSKSIYSRTRPSQTDPSQLSTIFGGPEKIAKFSRQSIHNTCMLHAPRYVDIIPPSDDVELSGFNCMHIHCSCSCTLNQTLISQLLIRLAFFNFESFFLTRYFDVEQFMGSFYLYPSCMMRRITNCFVP